MLLRTASNATCVTAHRVEVVQEEGQRDEHDRALRPARESTSGISTDLTLESDFNVQTSGRVGLVSRVRLASALWAADQGVSVLRAGCDSAQSVTR